NLREPGSDYRSLPRPCAAGCYSAMEARNPATFSMSGALIIAILAARRATRVDPMAALRQE
ncbi:MAG: hypothetical protein WBY44_20000, partial [Bryobacteraceae bacterium]